MANRTPVVVANWKMSGDSELIDRLAEQLSSNPDAHGSAGAELVFCPPSIYLEQAKRTFPTEQLALGGQNVSQHEQGAYTGEISASMLMSMGCRYSIIGHSERRRLFSETSDIVAEKFATLQRHHLTPILCLGESGPARSARRAFEVIAEELDIVIDKCGTLAFDNAIVAYEPIWAVGSGKCATPEQAQEMHAFIRRRIAEENPVVAEKLRIIYGGSLTPANVSEMFAQADVDGGLIGQASLDPLSLMEILRIASRQ